MLYIFNKTISDSKSIVYSLTILYGINKYQANKICKTIGINPRITINKLKNNHVNRLINYINKNLKIEQTLKLLKKDKLNDLLSIKTNKSIRQSQGLPIRGQRTHTNAKTAKKNKKININVFQKKIKKNENSKKNKKK